ncbi:MAG: glycosyltransferase family 39 protein [Candidatus Pacearchaeota archaeon]
MKKNIFLILILAILISTALKVFIINNKEVITDEQIYNVRAIDWLKTRGLSTIDQSPLYFYFTDISYHLFGVTTFAGRFMGLLFGGFTIIVVFLLTKRFFEERQAIIAALLLGFSSIFLYELIEMDPIASFFSITAFYFLVIAVHDNNKSFFYLSAFSYGISILFKTTTAMTIFGLFAYYVFSVHNKKDVRTITKLLLTFSVIAFFIMTPIFIYNYLLYSDKGITDLLFDKFLGINHPTYQGLASAKFSLSYFPKGLFQITRNILLFDSILFVTAIMGFYFFIKKKNIFGISTLIFMIFPYLLLSGSSISQHHFVIILPVLAISASYFLNKIKSNKLIVSIFMVFLLLNSYTAISHALPKGQTNQLKEFSTSIPEDAIIIVDSRIYKGVFSWSFFGKNYLDTNSFSEFLSKQTNLSVTKNIYFVECVPDNCGYASSQLNEFNEKFVEFFSQGEYIKTIKEQDREIFHISKLTLQIPPGVEEFAKSTYEFYYYPSAGYSEKERFDSYKTTGIKNILNSFGYLILYFSLIGAVLIPFLITYIFFKEIE